MRGPLYLPPPCTSPYVDRRVQKCPTLSKTFSFGEPSGKSVRRLGRRSRISGAVPRNNAKSFPRPYLTSEEFSSDGCGGRASETRHSTQTHASREESRVKASPPARTCCLSLTPPEEEYGRGQKSSGLQPKSPRPLLPPRSLESQSLTAESGPGGSL